MNKTFSIIFTLIIAISALVSCAQPVGNPTAPAAVSAPTSVSATKSNGIPVTYQERNLANVPPDIDESYFQLIAVPVGQAGTQTTTIAQPSLLDSLSNALKSYLFKTDTAVASVVKLKIGSQDLGTHAIIVIHPGDTDHKVYGEPIISPGFRSSDAVQVQFVTGRKVTPESHVFQTLVPAFMELSGLFANGNVLINSLKGTSDLPAKMKKVDSEFEKVFSADEQILEAPRMLDVSKTGSFLVSINGTDLIEIKVVQMGSLLAPGNDPKRMPKLSSEIQGRSISGKRIDVLVQPMQNEFDKNSAEGYAAFCRGVAKDLATLGLNDVDRATILYSYLNQSRWNNNNSFRTDADPCTVETQALSKTALALRSTTENAVLLTSDRDKRRVSMNEGIWNSLPIVLPMPAGSAWNNLAGDNVSFVSLKYPLTLGGKALEAGKAIDMNVAEAMNFLQKTKFTYDKARAIKDGSIKDEQCFSVNGTRTSSFRGYCFYLDLSDGARPLMMEFDFDGEFPMSKDDDQPRLIGVKFFPTS